MNPPVAAIIAALITASASLTVAIVTAVLGYRFKRRSDEQLGRLAEAQAERNALRDYQYEARKRLYADLQPIFFQMAELSDSAFRHIVALARTARQGHLGLGQDSWWLDDYYLRSSVHRLLVPLVLIRFCQRRLTFVDLSVDPMTARQYRLARGIWSSWNSGFDLAAADPSVAYDPHHTKAHDLVQHEPAVYRLQHLYAGQVDRIVAALTIGDATAARYITYGEFEDEFDRTDSKVCQHVGPAIDLFSGFHPQLSPVFWRMLLVQAHLYKAFSRSFNDSSQSSLPPSDILSEEEQEALDWREPGSDRTREEALEAPLRAARAYLIRYVSR